MFTAGAHRYGFSCIRLDISAFRMEQNSEWKAGLGAITLAYVAWSRHCAHRRRPPVIHLSLHPRPHLEKISIEVDLCRHIVIDTNSTPQRSRGSERWSMNSSRCRNVQWSHWLHQNGPATLWIAPRFIVRFMLDWQFLDHYLSVVTIPSQTNLTLFHCY